VIKYRHHRHTSTENLKENEVEFCLLTYLSKNDPIAGRKMATFCRDINGPDSITKMWAFLKK